MSKLETLNSLSRFPHLLYKVLKWGAGSDEAFNDTRQLTGDVEEADIITSQLANEPGWHTIMLDIDVPAVLVPSTTPGHSHLYIDVKARWRDYSSLLRELERCKIIERGYLGVSLQNGLTSLRLPWVKRDKERAASASRVEPAESTEESPQAVTAEQVPSQRAEVAEAAA